MKSIKLSDSELNFIREHYEAELEAAEKFMVQVKEILAKLGVPKKSSIDVSTEKEEKIAKKRGRKPGKKAAAFKDVPKKRGRKPKSGLIEVKPEQEHTGPILTEDKKKPAPKLKRTPKTKVEKPIAEKTDLKSEKIMINQKKVGKTNKKKKTNRRFRKGVYLAPLSKPLKKKEQIETQTANQTIEP